MPLSRAVLATILSDKPIPEPTRAYFRSRFADRLHRIIADEMEHQDLNNRAGYAKLASRVEMTSLELQSFLTQPASFELEVFLDLILALRMSEIGAQLQPVEDNPELWQRPLPARRIEKRRRR